MKNEQLEKDSESAFKEWIDEFEITSVNEDAVTSGRDWCHAGFTAGFEAGYLLALERVHDTADAIEECAAEIQDLARSFE